MTEAEWMACIEPLDMMQFLRTNRVKGDNSWRQAVHFACAAIRRFYTRQTDERTRRAMKFAELYLDGRADASELEDAYQLAKTVYEERRSRLTSGSRKDYLGQRARAVLYALGAASAGNFSARGTDWAITSAMDVREFLLDSVPNLSRRDQEKIAQCVLLRDIFGNPFRPVSFSLSWRTDTALALARQMYESRDFSAMPILADALQDAGCDSADLLDHSRSPGPHVRGCWVIDLVLGKE